MADDRKQFSTYGIQKYVWQVGYMNTEQRKLVESALTIFIRERGMISPSDVKYKLSFLESGGFITGSHTKALIEKMFAE